MENDLQPKTFRELCSKIAKSEGKLKQVSIGNIREIMSLVSKLIYSDPKSLLILLKNGEKLVKKDE